MSVEAMAWVLNHSTTSGTEKLILLGIASHADSEGKNAWPSVATLGRYAGVNERNARKALRRLETMGAIRMTKNGGGSHRTRVDRRPNLYEINLWITASSGGSAATAPDWYGGSHSAERGVANGPDGGSEETGETSFKHPLNVRGFQPEYLGKDDNLTNIRDILSKYRKGKGAA